MRIQFIEPDPRAGSQAQMDSKRGQQFIDDGIAVRVNEDGTAQATLTPPPSVSPRTALAIEMAGALDQALAALPGEYDDADYVVRGMRREFGALFTDEDEAKVRELVPPAAAADSSSTPAADSAAGATEAVADAAAPPDAATPANSPLPSDSAPAAADPEPAAAPAAARTTSRSTARNRT